VFTINKTVQNQIEMQNQEEVVENITHTIATTSALGLLLLIFVLFITIRNIFKPIKKLTDSANMIASGDLTLDIDSIFDIKHGEQKKQTKNEIYILSVALKKMLYQLNLTEELSNLNEKLSEALKTKSEFLAKMSHEIRTPKNAITGMAELALREDMPNSTREHVLTIKQASANLLSIINDILDFSKIESGKMEIIPVNYLFASLINDVISIIRMRVVDLRLRFVVNIDSNIPNALFGDETRVRQILLNVLSNATKYTKKGFISFSVSGEITDDYTILLTIDVEDSGRGIKKEDIERLFDDFAQFDLAKNKDVEGTGLGLAITKSLVNAMGGDISVYSEYEKGSMFTITLPQKIVSPEPLAAVENPEKKKVLVYERRQKYADSMICNIDNLGVTCARVESDEEMREKLKTDDYSFVFIAYALLDNVKKILSELGSKAEIVIITGFGNAIADKGLNMLTMPVNSISVANILNGVSDNFSYSANSNIIARICAPKARVLVVDDINTNLKVTEGLLSPYEMQVDLCLNGLEAIKAVKNNQYDLVFMDHMMPEMNGVDATKHIRELGDDYHINLPIIALTANAVSGTKEMFLSSGFDDFLSKPIDTVKLNNILEKWLPREKQEKLNREIRINEDSDLDEAVEIDGVNIKKGISITGGVLKNYLQTLSVFHKDGIQKIEQLKKCLESNDYSLYATYTHALKGASASIGADELSEMAKQLEFAGKQEDVQFIKMHNDEFLINLQNLLNNIKAALGEKREKPVNLEILKSKLAILKEALLGMNINVINEVTNDLQKFTQAIGVGADVEKILQDTLMGDYDEAVVKIEGLLK
jgi:signal transduction histidine kinase/CheY-like chemotaxis protein/HPt (histidine-containing phosphotransfer) domain-containing protein